MQPLPTPEEMSRWDHAAIERGIPEFTLMENAAREAMHVLRGLVGNVEKRRILLFMGGGNNGGDAACLARHLHDAGAETLVLHTRPLKVYKGNDGTPSSPCPELRRAVRSRIRLAGTFSLHSMASRLFG